MPRRRDTVFVEDTMMIFRHIRRTISAYGESAHVADVHYDGWRQRGNPAYQ